MRTSSGVRALVLVVLSGLLSFGASVYAQNFNITINNSPNPVLVSNALTYEIMVEETTAFFLPAFVTSSISGPAVVTGALPLNLLEGQVANPVVFAFPQTTNRQQFSVTVRPEAVGFITNLVDVGNGIVIYRGASVVNQVVTNAVPGVTNADLAVGISGLQTPPRTVIVNELVSYEVNVTNLGPAVAPSVILSNSSAPTNVLVILQRIRPDHLRFTNGVVPLGSLPSSAVFRATLEVQATAEGLVTLFADVFDPNITDPNPTNNTAQAQVLVTNSLPGEFEIASVTDQELNYQTGLVEQRIRVTNIGENAVPSIRVLAFDLGPRNELFNAVGTNVVNTNTLEAFVQHGAMLNPGDNVELLMEFLKRDREPIIPFTNYTAIAVPALDLSASSTNSLAITNTFELPENRGVLVEFRAELGRSYTILYTDNGTNTFRAEPSIVAPANVVQWIDAGPPKTLSYPGSNRVYSYFLNP